MTTSPTSPGDAIVQELIIDAPAERIFEALTNPQQLVQWWGVEGRFQTTAADLDLRPGGKFAMSGIGMGGRPFTVTGQYRAVERPRLIELTWLPSWQGDGHESLVRWDIDEKNGVTRVRITHSALNDAARAVHRGWPQILEWLRTYLEAQAR
jgi:uncharacterized protein YndB with AHSA1/START domain